MNGVHNDISEEFIPAAAAPEDVPVSPAAPLLPQAFQFDATDRLRLTVWNIVQLTTVSVHYRMWRPRAGSIAGRESFPVASDAEPEQFEFEIGVGYLQNLVVFSAGGAFRVGATFIRLEVVRGRAGAAISLGVILQGYITPRQQLAWPGSPIQRADEVDPPIQHIEGTTPAAGDPVTETVPDGTSWELVSFSAVLITDATVPARRVYLSHQEVSSGTGILWQSYGPYQQVASLTVQYYWVAGAAADPDVPLSLRLISLPTRVRLRGGTFFVVGALNLAAGDEWNFPAYTIRERLEIG